MMNATLFRCRSNCGEQAWSGQATGAVPPDGSMLTYFNPQFLSADAVIAYWSTREPSGRSPTLTASDTFKPSPEIQPTIVTHRPGSVRRFCPIDF